MNKNVRNKFVINHNLRENILRLEKKLAFKKKIFFWLELGLFKKYFSPWNKFFQIDQAVNNKFVINQNSWKNILSSGKIRWKTSVFEIFCKVQLDLRLLKKYFSVWNNFFLIDQSVKNKIVIERKFKKKWGSEKNRWKKWP